MLCPTIESDNCKGIWSSRENVSYLDVNIRNFMVIDDQMIEASKDYLIVNPFTKGSHVEQIKGPFFFLENLNADF